jgi:hypothetical protein
MCPQSLFCSFEDGEGERPIRFGDFLSEFVRAVVRLAFCTKHKV